MSEGAAKKEERRKFQAIKGTRDLLPPETSLWNRVEQTAHEVFATFGFGEIRLPVFEATELFARGVGEETDIVGKEMYSFPEHESQTLELLQRDAIQWHEEANKVRDIDLFTGSIRAFSRRLNKALQSGELPTSPALQSRYDTLKNLLAATEANRTEIYSSSTDTDPEVLLLRPKLLAALESFYFGDWVSLRPEATASVCRAYIEHNMQQWPQPVKLYTIGPMFRRERPQKGRYRQFYQIDAEVLGGSDAPAIDAELIEMVMTFFERVGLEGVELEINCIGDRKCRPKYVELLRRELSKVKEKLGPDSQRRIDTNPLRVLDSKLESEQRVIERLPRIADHLCKDCAEHYAAVKRELDLRGVKYQENWRLVRGLDYYMRTTFEITAQGLGSQNAVCGGGRYDGLVELLGGPPTKGIGFAIGEDRLILSLQESGKRRTPPVIEASTVEAAFTADAYLVRALDVYIAWMGEKAHATAIRAGKDLRNAGFSVELPPLEQKFGKALGQADKLGAKFALILGDNEVSSGEWTLKTLATGEQSKFTEPNLLEYLKKNL